MRDVCKSKKAYYHQFSKFVLKKLTSWKEILFTQILPDYEKQCLSEFTNNDITEFVFLDPQDTNMNEILGNLVSHSTVKFHKFKRDGLSMDSIEHLQAMIVYQVREVTAFLEGFATKRRLESAKVKATKK